MWCVSFILTFVCILDECVYECVCMHIRAHMLLNSDLGIFQGNDLEQKVPLTTYIEKKSRF